MPEQVFRVENRLFECFSGLGHGRLLKSYMKANGAYLSRSAVDE